MNEENYEKVDLFLDIKGAKCPIPEMSVRLNMSKLPPGGIMKVISDTGYSKISIPRFCKNFGHKILLLLEENENITFIIKKHEENKNSKQI